MRGSVGGMTMEEKLRAIMRATDWKQQKLAEVFSVGQSTINRWLVKGAQPKGDRRDHINLIYSQIVESKQTLSDAPIHGDEEILAMLRRIDGLTTKDIDAALWVITTALNANKAGSKQADAGDQSEPAIPRHVSPSSR